jgi:hypothetical protein
MKNQMNESEFYNYEDEKLLVAYLKEKELKSRYQSLLSEQYGINPANKEVKIKKIQFWKYAAVFVVFIACIFVFNLVNYSSSETLAMEYAKNTLTLGNQEVMRKDLATDEDTRIKANLAFINQNYTESISEYEKLYQSNKATHSDFFYLGVGYIKNAIPNPSKAIFYLNKAKGNNHFNQEIYWYLALSYTVNKQYREALEHLNYLTTNSNYKHEEVQKLKIIIQKEMK